MFSDKTLSIINHIFLNQQRTSPRLGAEGKKPAIAVSSLTKLMTCGFPNLRNSKPAPF